MVKKSVSNKKLRETPQNRYNSKLNVFDIIQYFVRHFPVKFRKTL